MHCSYNDWVMYAAVSLCPNGQRRAEQCVLCMQTTSIGFLHDGKMTENPCKRSGLQGEGYCGLPENKKRSTGIRLCSSYKAKASENTNSRPSKNPNRLLPI